MVKDIRSKVRKVLIVTLILNMTVVAIKGIIGVVTGSLSLQADALHSVTDGVNNILGLVMNQFASPMTDRDHPYGHQKFEALGALGIAVFLGIACFEIVSSAIARIINPIESVSISVVELGLLFLVLGINIFVALYERRVGKRLGSQILIADASHTMGDVWVTITVLAGLIAIWAANQGYIIALQTIDIWLAFPVAFLVFKSGWDVLRNNIPWLVDQMAIAPESIYQTVMEVEGVINCHDIASRGLLGRQVFIEMHLIVEPKDVETAHLITEKVEKKLQEKFYPARILIHIEPLSYQSDQITFDDE
ncbi:cation diffusion facilitator family transporter [Cyanobacterium stanieri PCC 7202]|uniref:Cation diffusion facilitator family transporter n=1 Tax=Cyanobacterium stanieri (strain ATCC 29140 / PCC 7202) TaxID=292563 RepID=K9YLS1_CYASC|nr:cation diffusion facilitator family transporter [Cyanobacterium stanieri PCC 7202]